MSRRPFAVLLACASTSLVVVAAGCAEPVLTVEVLPPRTSITCAAPTVDDAALGTGLMDAKATDNSHGGYLADLRMVISGADARVDGVDVKITRDGKELAVLSDVPTGDVLLVGKDDDVRKGVVENVELVPRDVTKKLADDSKITDLEFATLVVQISPLVVDAGVTGAASTFALDVCNGCLVTAPSSDTCAVVAPNPVCRTGQDVPSFSCAQAAAGANP